MDTKELIKWLRGIEIGTVIDDVEIIVAIIKSLKHYETLLHETKELRKIIHTHLKGFYVG